MAIIPKDSDGRVVAVVVVVVVAAVVVVVDDVVSSSCHRRARLVPMETRCRRRISSGSASRLVPMETRRRRVIVGLGLSTTGSDGDDHSRLVPMETPPTTHVSHGV